MAKLGEKKVLYGSILFVIVMVVAILAIGYSAVVEEKCHEVAGIDGSSHRIGAFSCEILKDGKWLEPDEFMNRKSAELDIMEERFEKYKERIEAIRRKQEFMLKYKIMEI